MHVYADVSHVITSGSYFQINVHRTVALNKLVDLIVGPTVTREQSNIQPREVEWMISKIQFSNYMS